MKILGAGDITHRSHQHGGDGNDEVRPPHLVEGQLPDMDHGQNTLVHALDQMGNGAGDILQRRDAEKIANGDKNSQQKVDGIGNQRHQQPAQGVEGDLPVLDAQAILGARLVGGTGGQKQLEDDGGDTAPKKQRVAFGIDGRHGQGKADHGDGELVQCQAHTLVGIPFKECFHVHTLRIFVTPYYTE